MQLEELILLLFFLQMTNNRLQLENDSTIADDDIFDDESSFESAYVTSP